MAKKTSVATEWIYSGEPREFPVIAICNETPFKIMPTSKSELFSSKESYDNFSHEVSKTCILNREKKPGFTSSCEHATFFD